MRCIKKIFRGLAGAAAVVSLGVFTAVGLANREIPTRFQVTAGKDFQLESPGISVSTYFSNELTAAASSPAGNGYQAKVMLFNAIPVKTVDVSVVREMQVIPCGTPFGIKMFTNGVMVVGISDIQSDGAIVNPASKAGLKVGDIIVSVNGEEMNQNEQVAAAIEKSFGKPVSVTVKRDNVLLDTVLEPVKSDVDSSYKGGLWVRDSTAGIGTVTFYNPTNGAFAGLGHGICDIDTAEIMPLGSGDIVPVTISGVVKGEKGKAGELRGYFSSDVPVGSLQANVEAGVYGTLNSSPVNREALKVAMKQEVKTGPAKVLTTVDGGEPRYYDIQIESVNYKNHAMSKNLVVCVTDPELLAKTGGIVQGMSGSPIIQDGMLVGAVTHVFVNDPTKGYGIFAENMMSVSQSVCMQAALAS